MSPTTEMTRLEHTSHQVDPGDEREGPGPPVRGRTDFIVPVANHSTVVVVVSEDLVTPVPQQGRERALPSTHRQKRHVEAQLHPGGRSTTRASGGYERGAGS